MQEFAKIIAVCALSFGPSLLFATHDFVFDDGVAVTRNDDVINTNRTVFESFRKIIVHDFWGQSLFDERSHKSYRPFVTFLFNLEFRYFNPVNLASGMKRANLLLHTVICCLIFDLFRKMFNDIHPSILVNAVVLFAAHPIHTEVICSVVGRADLLCAFVFFVVVYRYWEIATEHEQNGTMSWWKTAIMFDAAIICLFCKEIGIMVLPFCIFFDIVTNVKLPKVRKRDLARRFEFLRKNCYKLMKRCIILTIMTILLIFMRFFWVAFKFPKFKSFENPIAAHPSLFTRIFSSCYIHFLNTWLLLCPDWLCCDWSNGSIDLIESWKDYRIVNALIVYAFLIRGFYKGPRHVRIAIALLVIPFIPSSNLITVGFVIADRVLYIPSLGFCLLVAIGMQYIHSYYPKIISIIYWVMVVFFIARSNERSMDWQNNLQLFKSAVRIVPNNAKIYFNLGQLAALQNDYNKSLEYNLIANDLKPSSISTLINLGNAYRHLSKPAEALKYHRDVVKLDPTHPLGWMNLAITYVENGQLHEALACYLEADKLKPDNEKITFNLGNLYLRIGNRLMAEKMFRKSITLNPKSQRSHINLIVYLSEHGTQRELMSAIDNANITMFDNVPVLSAIASALSRINFDAERVVKIFKRIIELDAKNLMAHGQLAIHYHKRNKTKLAIKHYKKARSINPTFQVKDQRFAAFVEAWKATEMLKKKPEFMADMNKLQPDNKTDTKPSTKVMAK